MKTALISWIGKHDLNAEKSGELGPVLAAIQDVSQNSRSLSVVHLLCNYPAAQLDVYLSWLRSHIDTETVVTYKQVTLSSPTAYSEIYPVAFNELGRLSQQYPAYQKYVHLSPGTPAMTAVWVLLVKTYFPAVCLESWLDRTKGQQVRQVTLPFEIAAEFSHHALKQSSARLLSVESALPALAGIIGQSEPMQIAMKKAQRMAIREVPVLILGETGTGKEVFARAIHDASVRQGAAFIAVNCGALPEDLAESLLFGHKKGAFTGACNDHKGYFAEAHGGSLFLDEIGELSPLLQTKLLRVLQEKTFMPLGGNKQECSDFRLIAATHRPLMEMIDQGSFREDLFYRIAIGILKLPPIRERADDIRLLADAMMTEINEELADQPGYQKKQLSHDAMGYIASQSWPGNVRELRASILRASLWSDRTLLTADDIEAATLTRQPTKSLMPEALGENADVQNVIGTVAKHYISLALKETRGNKRKAAEKLGFNSSQVLDNWVKKYDVIVK